MPGMKRIGRKRSSLRIWKKISRSWRDRTGEGDWYRRFKGKKCSEGANKVKKGEGEIRMPKSSVT